MTSLFINYLIIKVYWRYLTIYKVCVFGHIMCNVLINRQKFTNVHVVLDWGGDIESNQFSTLGSKLLTPPLKHCRVCYFSLRALQHVVQPHLIWFSKGNCLGRKLVMKMRYFKHNPSIAKNFQCGCPWMMAPRNKRCLLSGENPE